MKFFIVATLLIIAGISCTNNSIENNKNFSDSELFAEFQKFMTTFEKKYSSIEETKERFEIFKENFIHAQKHNQLIQMKKYDTAQQGITQFMDLTTEEFRRVYLNLKMSTLDRIRAQNSENYEIKRRNGAAPDSWDWREHGAVSPVKNQGQCGSCWAFSAIGNIEGQYQMKTQKSAVFSEQQLVDCDKVDQGCNGGLMDQAFEHLETSGVMLSADYPYTGRQGTCNFDQSKIAAKVYGYNFASGDKDTPANEDDLKQKLYDNGPFAIAINATPLQFYFGGILNPYDFLCNPKGLNHGVLLVGYGVEGDKPYWIVKNSWGASWGEKGYFRIIRGKGKCGVNQFVVSAKVNDI